MRPTTAQVLTTAISTYGNIHQIIKAMEEMDELGKELCKVLCLRESEAIPAELHDHIAEEMADVKIMIAQLEMIFNNTDAVNKHINSKISRLHERLKDGERKCS